MQILIATNGLLSWFIGSPNIAQQISSIENKAINLMHKQYDN